MPCCTDACECRFPPRAALNSPAGVGPAPPVRKLRGSVVPALVRGSVGPALVEGRRRFRVVLGEGSVLPAGWLEINGSNCRAFSQR